MNDDLTPWEDAPARLRKALEQDELTLFAQPIMSLRGAPDEYPLAEVLVRLREEEQALLPPGEFLPAFAHYGMMRDLDRWVTRNAIAELARGLTVAHLTINVSAHTLDDVEFPPRVAAELARARVPAWALVFEVDESDVLQRPAAAEQFAASMKKVGCRLLIDSFGQRSISFAPLTALKADFVKVDGVIVRKLQVSNVARTKLNAIVRVGDVIGISVIGECVEEPETLRALRECGAGFAQGFGLRAPAPIAGLLRR